MEALGVGLEGSVDDAKGGEGQGSDTGALGYIKQLSPDAN